MRSRKRGFTLIELMVVVVIIGILAAIIIPPLMWRLGGHTGPVRHEARSVTIVSQDYGYRLSEGDYSQTCITATEATKKANIYLTTGL